MQAPLTRWINYPSLSWSWEEFTFRSQAVNSPAKVPGEDVEDGRRGGDILLSQHGVHRGTRRHGREVRRYYVWYTKTYKFTTPAFGASLLNFKVQDTFSVISPLFSDVFGDLFPDRRSWQFFANSILPSYPFLSFVNALMLSSIPPPPPPPVSAEYFVRGSGIGITRGLG